MNPQKDKMQNTSSLLLLMIYLLQEIKERGREKKGLEYLEGSCIRWFYFWPFLLEISIRNILTVSRLSCDFQVYIKLNTLIKVFLGYCLAEGYIFLMRAAVNFRPWAECIGTLHDFTYGLGMFCPSPLQLTKWDSYPVKSHTRFQSYTKSQKNQSKFNIWSGHVMKLYPSFKTH